MKIAVIGVTGLVGRTMVKTLEESRFFQNIEFVPAASPQSVGEKVDFNGKTFTILSVEDAIKARPHIALFSAGSHVSRMYAKQFTSEGTFVIDNSSAWRSDALVPLVVPQVNGQCLTRKSKIIANPNCSTIQLVMIASPLHDAYGIKRMVISTYQSVTGSGMKGVHQLESERRNLKADMCYPYPIDLNVIPQGGDFLDNGYTTEEMKLVNETRKILANNHLRITATVVRVPVLGGHSLSVNMEFEKDFDLTIVRDLLKRMPGVIIEDDPDSLVYPMPMFAYDRDEVFVGRIRRDESNPNSLNMWIVADNLRKGAATNAVQIAEHIITHEII
jgi:aspartate-semialdehyde dehydrogenase